MYSKVLRKSCSLRSGPPCCFRYPPGPIPIYLNIIDYIPHAVIYISVAIMQLAICTAYSFHLSTQSPTPVPQLQSIFICLNTAFPRALLAHKILINFLKNLPYLSKLQNILFDNSGYENISSTRLNSGN